MVFVFSILMTPTFSKPPRAGVSDMGHLHSARLAILVIGLLACFWGMWNSGREGLAQLFAGYGLMTDRLEEAERAVRLGPAIPEAHYVRASLLKNRDELAEAVKEFEQAVALRPRDYALWLELGRARDQASDVEGALAAFRESARLAPFYAQPYWQLGNTLLRSGRRDEAMDELRRAASSDTKLLPSAINLAWAVLDRDPRAVEQAIQPQTASAHMTLASFFAIHGKPAESIMQFRAAGAVSNEQRRALLADLLASKNFAEAFEVWSSGRQTNSKGNHQRFVALVNGGFEEPITLDDPGFGWQLAGDLQSVRASLDPAQPHAGTHSLRLDWNGESNPSTPILSQLVLVEPTTRFRLTFAVRMQEMLTIGLPIVTVSDAREMGRISAQSEPFSRGTTGWQNYALEFSTTETMTAVQIIIRRENCATTPCAAIGHAWVDEFSLQKL